MHPDFWLARWQEGRLGFHEGAVNRHLQRWWDAAVGAAAAAPEVLVPLCGKAHDLHWLAARGHRVTGVELSPLACASAFSEHGVVPTLGTRGPFAMRAAGNLTLLQGDVFDLRGSWDAVWDRAALVALPPETRPRYVAHLRTLLRPGGRLLLVTMDYPQAERAGPPFAVPADEVRALWPEARLLHREDLPGDRLREQGVSRMAEEVWAVEIAG